MDPKYFAPIAENLEGVRCLRQDPWECAISFICSSNNNIKRIAQLVNSLRVNYGSKIDISDEFIKEHGLDPEAEEFAFPTMEQLLKATESEFREYGFGYRAGYITESCKLIKANGGTTWL